jgi:CRISPR/Cas system-associated endonuclease Cas1
MIGSLEIDDVFYTIEIVEFPHNMSSKLLDLFINKQQKVIFITWNSLPRVALIPDEGPKC